MRIAELRENIETAHQHALLLDNELATPSSTSTQVANPFATTHIEEARNNFHQAMKSRGMIEDLRAQTIGSSIASLNRIAEDAIKSKSELYSDILPLEKKEYKFRRLAEIGQALEQIQSNYSNISPLLDQIDTETTDRISSQIGPTELPPPPEPASQSQPSKIRLSPDEFRDLGRENDQIISCDGDGCGREFLRENAHRFLTTEEGRCLCGQCRDSDRSIQ